MTSIEVSFANENLLNERTSGFRFMTVYIDWLDYRRLSLWSQGLRHFSTGVSDLCWMEIKLSMALSNGWTFLRGAPGEEMNMPERNGHSSL